MRVPVARRRAARAAPPAAAHADGAEPHRRRRHARRPTAGGSPATRRAGRRSGWPTLAPRQARPARRRRGARRAHRRARAGPRPRTTTASGRCGCRRPTRVVICAFERVASLRERIGAGAHRHHLRLAAVALGGAAAARGVHALVRARRPRRRFPRRPLHGRLGDALRGDRAERGRLAAPMLVGWEFGEYFWEAILDAGVNLGITPVSASRAARGGGRRDRAC